MNKSTHSANFRAVTKLLNRLWTRLGPQKRGFYSLVEKRAFETRLRDLRTRGPLNISF